VGLYITFNLKDGISDVHVLSLASKRSTSPKRWKLFCLLDTLHNTNDYKKKDLTVFQKNNSEKQWVRFGSTHKNTKIFTINLRSISYMEPRRMIIERNKISCFSLLTSPTKKTSQFSHSCIKVVFLFFVSSEPETDSMLSLHYCNNPDVISFLKRRKTRPRD
jgi:hypothetical protein